MRIITKGLIEEFKKFLIEEEKSKNTTEKYCRDVTVFAEWLGGRELNKSVVLQYKSDIIERFAPVSVNSIISSLNSFFSYVKWFDLKVKTLKIQRQIFLNKNKELTKSEYARLLFAAKSKKNTRLYYLIQTICSTGIRVSELKHITIEAVNQGQAVINCKGKMRLVLLPKDLCKMLKSYAKNRKIASGAIFISRNNNPLDRSHIWKMLKALCDDAGVLSSKVFPHNLRHLFARTFYSLQKDIVRLADILGHASINTTRIYTVETGETHLKQIQRLGLLYT
ncbi:MAG: tyrosine-type recombinase/integrase [Clostridia bacterium]|nr:tyrosine-type recombinase/integrase [Clostridia bacterium]